MLDTYLNMSTQHTYLPLVIFTESHVPSQVAVSLLCASHLCTTYSFPRIYPVYVKIRFMTNYVCEHCTVLMQEFGRKTSRPAYI